MASQAMNKRNAGNSEKTRSVVSFDGNLHYYFHNTYFAFLVEKCAKGEKSWMKLADLKTDKQLLKTLRKQNEEIISASVRADYPHPLANLANVEFDLSTRYPGLLVGVGELHSVGAPGEIALGCSLDYVTGMPVIPGSSVKGMLRAAFRLGDGVVVKGKLKELQLERVSPKELETAVFGDAQAELTGERDDPFERDVFFDAYVVKGENGRCLALDNITPHRQNTQLLELAEPNPLTMLKIAPEATIHFSFRLKDSEVGGQTVRLEQKKQLFQFLLCELGIGAKTNTGYGVLRISE